MQTFQTAAVVGLIDNMSGPLKALSKQAAALAKEFTSGGKGANAQGMNAHVDALRAAMSDPEVLQAALRISE